MILKVGDVYSTSKCGDIVITDYISAKEVKVRFLDSGTEVITAAKEIMTHQRKLFMLIKKLKRLTLKRLLKNIKVK